ncbi:hypothetical protein [Trebonia kvetii]|uniref:hypothetical protein n=1 Tax=Trebonia kvetii TaxID=2480626 RepID=UPI0016526713|nr:hypothetical protein [Trebonia kvetii]
MDEPTVRYLDPIAGLDAAMWVPPSRGQLFWLRFAPAFFAPAGGTGRGLVRWWALATVTPSTNVTGLNLVYQSYLNHVFHRTRLARAGHAVCMPVIVTALLALLFPVHAILPAAIVLAAWWAYWAVKERDPVWGGCGIALAAALYPLAQALGRLGAAEHSPLAQPWALVLIGGALQAGSHILEPLPPRVTRSMHWVAPAQYLLGRPGHRNPAGTVARRAAQLAAQAIFGTVDEIVASPRLLPVLLLELLFLFGHHPARRAAWRALSAQAIASGNPALDYIGTGGPTPLRTGPTAPLKPHYRATNASSPRTWCRRRRCRGRSCRSPQSRPSNQRRTGSQSTTQSRGDGQPRRTSRRVTRKAPAARAGRRGRATPRQHHAQGDPPDRPPCPHHPLEGA